MALLLPTLSFCQQFTPFGHYNISLKAKGVKSGTKIYLFYQTEGKKIVDSAMSDNGLFHLAGEAAKPLPATLVLDSGNEGYKSILEHLNMTGNILQFYIHPGNIVAGTDGALCETKFFTSDINKDFSILQVNLNNIHRQEIKINQTILTEQDTAKLKPLEKTYDSLTMARMPILKKFIFGHPKSYISLVALSEFYCRLLGIDNYKLTNAHITESKEIFNSLDKQVRNTSDGGNLARQFSNTKLLAIGEIAPDFTQPDKDGNPVKLSDFKGKYVLVDFWASWCGPCRQNNSLLVKLYEEFSGKKFTILGISLDDVEGRAAWLKAVKDDGLPWMQVSDLKHWDNAVAKLYAIAAIPQSILVGPDGTIVLNGPTAEELKVKLNQLLPAR